MSTITIRLQVPKDLSRFKLPAGVNSRLQDLLDKQDSGTPLTKAERAEADGLVNLAETLSWLRMRAERPRKQRNRKA